MKRVKIRKVLDASEGFWRADDFFIGVVGAMEFMVVRPAVKAALAVSTGIAKNGSLSSATFVIDLDEQCDRDFSAKATMSGGSVKNGVRSLLKKLFLNVS